MATKKKLLQAAAGAAGGEGLNVEDVFSTYLYEGTGAAQTITNGIDLSGEGGLVWSKNRDFGENHCLVDTVRGGTKELLSSSSNAEGTSGNISAFNSDGYSFPNIGRGNYTGYDYASWTFRKAPKFFDVVTYTGDGVAGRTVSHNLGSVPGCIIIKRTDSTSFWVTYHRSTGNSNVLYLNLTNAAQSSTVFNSTTPTDSVFTLSGSSEVNISGGTYVAYLFAHNDGDGDFGPDGDADIIKCGSYTGTGAVGNQVTLGFEPQWLLIKRTSGTGNWILLDNMRGIPTESSALTDRVLKPNKSDAEALDKHVNLDATGFILNDTGTLVNGSGDTYSYIAIRRGPMAVPEDATDVFAISDASGTDTPLYKSSFPIDMGFEKNSAGTNDWQIYSRLTEKQRLQTNTTAAETTVSTATFDFMNGYKDVSVNLPDYYAWMWRRAPNFFDVVAYTGNGTSGRTVSHNLGVAPEMMWVKNRIDATSWGVYHKGLNGGTNPADYTLLLNSSIAQLDNAGFWNDTVPTDTVFTVGTAQETNGTNDNMIAYLFASLDGVSKVGSYTGNGSSDGDSQNIDCGFSSGARFVLIKRTDLSSSWLVFDSTRGIVAGNDPLFALNLTNAQYTITDEIDPYSSGFAVTYDPIGFATNVSGASYIFYAIA